MEELLHAIKEVSIESLHLVPFLLLTYLVMELIEHRAEEKTKQAIKKAGMAGPFVGSLLGAFPQCGFSAAASNLYAGRVITVGTLISIYLSTSDEMLPILISENAGMGTITKIIVAKIIIGMVTGYTIELILALKKIKRSEMNIHAICEEEHCHCDDEEEEEEHDHEEHDHGENSHGEHDHHHHHHKNGSWIIVRSALIHTIKIFVFIFIISVVLHILIGHESEEALSEVLIDIPVLGEMLAGLVGLIPNCAGSVVVTQLYLKGVIGAGAMMSGLLVSAGVGVIILLRINRKDTKKNLAIIGTLYASGVLWGILISLLNITF